MHLSKNCFKCNQDKPRTEFYPHPAMGDGLLGKCKDCTKKDALEHRLKNLDKVRAYDRARAKNPERVKASIKYHRYWRQADTRRAKCHNAVARAIRSGLLEVKPCIVCGSDNSMAHHESYDRPLEVVWYCQVHHTERHKQMAIEGIET